MSEAPEAEAPLISLIIPTCNRPADLKRCLERLSPQISDLGMIEVLLGDDGDAEHPSLPSNLPPLRWIRGPKNGPGANRNATARQARGRWLIFLDDDCLPHPGLLAAYVGAINETPPGEPALLAGPVIRTEPHRESLLWEAPHNPELQGLPPSCNFAIPREIFSQSGGFDERYRISFEDMEFFARLGHMDIPLHFVKEAAVDHPSRPLPSPSKLANRWESRVISCVDLGASPVQVLLQLPRHILLVIFSRFRDRTWDRESLRAARQFSAEFFIALFRLPEWLRKYAKSQRSPFWMQQVRDGKAPPRFGL